MSLNQEESLRYERQLLLDEVGEEGQEKLKSARVLIVGAGGLGSPAAMYLAAAGVGHIGIADGDRVELSNLQRQLLHTTSDLGRLKAESAERALLAINPLVEVTPIPTFLTADNLGDVISDYDLVLDCTDNGETKFLLNDVCVSLGKPLIHAGIGRFRGQMMTILPHRTPCLRCVYGRPPEGEPSPREKGVIGAIPGVIGSLEALEAIKLLLGTGKSLTGRLLMFDGLNMQFRTVSLPQRRADCPVCGTK